MSWRAALSKQMEAGRDSEWGVTNAVFSQQDLEDMLGLILEHQRESEDGNNNPLQVFRLLGCRFPEIEEEFEVLGNVVHALVTNRPTTSNTLVALRLADCDLKSISPICFALLPKQGSEPSKLRELWLNGNKFPGWECTLLAKLLIAPELSLCLLDVSANSSVGDEGVTHLARALEHANCKLEMLGLNGCDITDAGAKRLQQALEKTEHTSCLRQLYLGGNAITQFDSPCRLPAQLAALSLYGNRLCAFPRSLLNNTTSLERLFLDGNCAMKEAGLALFCELALPRATRLKQLSLKEIGMSDEMGALVAQNLPSALEHLWLDDNRLGTQCALAFREALSKHARLQTLSLSGNAIMSKSAQELSSVFLQSSLHVLDLDAQSALHHHKHLVALQAYKRSADFQLMFLLASIGTIPRLSKGSLRLIPDDVFQLIASMLFAQQDYAKLAQRRQSSTQWTRAG